MSYVFNRDDAFAFADYIGAEYHEKGDELNFRYCPRCGGGTHGHDTDTFSINLTTGAFCCLRASCGYSGHFVELCRDFDYKLDYEAPRIYRKLPQPKEPIKPRDEAIRFLQSRGISPEIAKRFEITSMANRGHPEIIAFPFYDDQGTLQFLKYRHTNPRPKQPKEWCAKNTMPILFGMKQAKDFGAPLVITEGQLDSLSVAEAGIPNAVSVPTGANGFTWVVPCFEWVCKFPCVIVMGDYENGKITLLDALKARLPITVKCVRTQDYLGEKDANDILRKYGPGAVRKAIENAEVPKLENVKDLSTVRSVDLDDLDKIPTGITELDQCIGGLVMGQVVLLTGKRGQGKSTLGSNICGNALDAGESIFTYSGELADYHFKRWLDLQLIGSAHIEAAKRGEEDLEECVRKVSDWYRGRAYIYDNDYMPSDSTEYEGICETIEKVIKQYGTRLIFIDNLMTAMDIVTEQENLYLAQSNFVGRLKKIAMKYQVVVILVAHPRKSKDAFTNDDVSGSSDITNKVDVVMSYSRSEEKDATYQGVLQVTKNRLWGKLLMGKDAIRLRYSETSKRVYDDRPGKPRVYGWEFEQIDMAEADLPFD